MEREITDPVGYRYVLTIDAGRLHIQREKRQGCVVLTKMQAEGLKAYLDKALRSKPSGVVENYDGLTLRHDDKTSAIQAKQENSVMEMYPPSWDALASEIGLMIPYIDQTSQQAPVQRQQDTLH